MRYKDMKTAIAIVSQCDSLSITEDDKQLTISVFCTIIKSLKKIGLVTTQMLAMYAVLKESTFNNAYFCIVTRQMCSLIYPEVDFCQRHFDN